MHRKLLLVTALAAIVAFGFLIPGCDELVTETTEITIIDYPRAQFTASPRSGCASNLSVRFTDQSQPTSGLTFWVWSFGDGDSAYVQTTADSQYIIDYTDKASDTSSSKNPVHAYDSSGLFNVILTVTDTLDRTATEIKENYIVVGGPIAIFRINGSGPLTACQDTSIAFYNQSLGNAVEFTWLFENTDSGTIDTSFRYSPVHHFTKPGSYIVTLIAGSAECPDSDIFADSGLITIGNCPAIEFTVNGDTTRDTLCGGGEVTVDWVNTGGPIDSLLWVWGDNDSTLDPILQNPALHVYPAPDNNSTYTIKVVAYGDQGTNTSSLSGIIYNRPIVSTAFTATPDSGAAPLEVSFADQSDGSPTSFLWDFGDGTGTSTLSDPLYTFDTAGVFTVQLVTNNDCNVPDTATATITVSDTTGGAR